MYIASAQARAGRRRAAQQQQPRVYREPTPAEMQMMADEASRAKRAQWAADPHLSSRKRQWQAISDASRPLPQNQYAQVSGIPGYVAPRFRKQYAHKWNLTRDGMGTITSAARRLGRWE